METKVSYKNKNARANKKIATEMGTPYAHNKHRLSFAHFIELNRRNYGGATMRQNTKIRLTIQTQRSHTQITILCVDLLVEFLGRNCCVL